MQMQNTSDSPVYDPQRICAFYESRCQEEWDRWDRDVRSRLNYQMHRRVIDEAVLRGDRVLELAAGAGRFTKDLALITPHVTVTDLSERMLAFNRQMMGEMGVAEQVEDWAQADICDLSQFVPASFDIVTCFGALNYVFEREADALGEMLRVLRPQGKLILSVMSLPGLLRYSIGPAIEEFLSVGAAAVDWLVRTGKQDGLHYEPLVGNPFHMMTRRDVEALCDQAGGRITRAVCSGFLGTANPQALQDLADSEPWLWEKIVEMEWTFGQSPSLLEAGTHMLFTIQKDNA